MNRAAGVGRGAARLLVKAVPCASRSRLAGWIGPALKVRLAAPPERGATNAELVRLLAAALGVPGERVRLASGRGGKRKVVEIEGLAREQLRLRLARATTRGRP